MKAYIITAHVSFECMLASAVRASPEHARIPKARRIDSEFLGIELEELEQTRKIHFGSSASEGDRSDALACKQLASMGSREPNV